MKSLFQLAILLVSLFSITISNAQVRQVQDSNGGTVYSDGSRTTMTTL